MRKKRKQLTDEEIWEEICKGWVIGSYVLYRGVVMTYERFIEEYVTDTVKTKEI